MTVEIAVRGAVRPALVDDADAAVVGSYSWVTARTTGDTRPRAWAAGRPIHMHRLITRPPDDRSVDHINGDPFDNRRSNLRIVTHAENLQNRRNGYGKSRFRGVHWDKRGQKWRAEAMLNGQRHRLGSYATELEAAEAAQAWRDVHMPFANDDPELQRARSR